MKPFLFITVAALALLAACANPTQGPPQTQAQKANAEQVQALLQQEIAFSKMSADSGLKKAFLHYLADDAVLLRDDHYPIEGADQYLPYFKAMDDAKLQLTWEPFEGYVAAGGDLGFTYGIYELRSKAAQDTAARRGTYVTIWKKQGNQWKAFLDGGTQGLPAQPRPARNGDEPPRIRRTYVIQT
jgi:ketosteroid isomerase-like protein